MVLDRIRVADDDVPRFVLEVGALEIDENELKIVHVAEQVAPNQRHFTRIQFVKVLLVRERAKGYLLVQIDDGLEKEVLFVINEESLEVVLGEHVEFFDPAEVHDVFFEDEEGDFEQFVETVIFDDF